LINLGILISGRGSNMKAILSCIEAGSIRNVKPCIVIANKEGTPGLKTAQDFRIPTKVIDGQGIKGWEYDKKVVSSLASAGVTPESGLVCLAGYMRILSPEFVRMFKLRILNIHPSLLPAFPGLQSQKQALDYGVKVSGCTVHFVDESMDTGPIIIQKSVEVLDGDTEQSLSSRILEQEHIVYPQAINLFSQGRLEVHGRTVKIKVETQNNT